MNRHLSPKTRSQPRLKDRQVQLKVALITKILNNC